MNDVYLDTSPPMPQGAELRPIGVCPPGHLKAIAAGGLGHWHGDGCCNSNTVAASIDTYILVLLGFALGFIVDVYIRRKK